MTASNTNGSDSSDDKTFFEWESQASDAPSSSDNVHQEASAANKNPSNEDNLTEKDKEFLDKLSPAARELALPKLPEIGSTDQAGLQMQSPNKLYFYWSLKNDPFQQLKRSTSSTNSGYMLIVKLVDLKRNSETLYPIDRAGSWWFDVEANTQYEAEIGLYAANRPFIRILFSNIVTTPRKTPSPYQAGSEEWKIPSAKFAEVLKVSGFAKDAFDVAVAGDDAEMADISAFAALADYTGNKDLNISDFDSEDIRYALYGIASGLNLEDIRWHIGAGLYGILQQQDSDDKERAANALRSVFDVEVEEYFEDDFDSAIFGASSIHFPKKLRSRPHLAGLEPFSSHSLNT